MKRRRAAFAEVPVEPLPTARTKTPARIFSVGQILPSGRVADAAFLDAVVANWQQHQAKGDPTFPRPPAYLIPAPAVGIGHEDDQAIARAYAKRSDLPAVGWPDDVRREGDYLVAHFKGVPVGLAQWVESGAYRDCSAEFYENYEGFGPTLRRVSLVGADIPACKDLGGLPQFVIDPQEAEKPNPLAFTERLANFARAHRKGFAAVLGRGFVKFTESPTMNANQMALAAILQKLGVSPESLTPESLDSMLAIGAGAAAAAEPPDPNAPKPATAAEPPKPGCAAEPPKPAAVAAAAAEPPADPSKQPLATFTELVRTVVAAAVAPLQTQVTTIAGQLKSATGKLDAADTVAARASLATFCELHKDKIFPYELDPAVGPTLVDQALALPDAVVATFSEGKVSQRGAFLKLIANRPPVAKFAERIKAPASGNDQRDRVNGMLGATDIGRAALAARTAAAVPEPRK